MPKNLQGGGEEFMEPHILALVLGTLLEAFGALLYVMDEALWIAVLLIITGIIADIVGALMWAKASRRDRP